MRIIKLNNKWYVEIGHDYVNISSGFKPIIFYGKLSKYFLVVGSMRNSINSYGDLFE